LKYDFVNSPEIGEYADVFDYVIHYFEKGTGDPLIMIHGLGQSMYTFRKNIDELSRNFRVIALDLPGHGYSDVPETDYTIDQFTNALIVFMSVLRIEKAHFFAFSTGAVIALNLAALYPEKVDRMILISPGGITKHYPFSIKALRMPIISDIMLTWGFTKKKIYNALLTAYFDRTMINEKMVEQIFEPFKNPETRDAFSIALRNFDDHIVYESLGSLTMPIYIFWGECDRWHPMEMLQEFAELLPFAFIATVRNSGHMIHEEKSREINRKVTECLLEPLVRPAEEEHIEGEIAAPADNGDYAEENTDNLEKIRESLSKMDPTQLDDYEDR
ncbi:MAG TPA: alpha/beta hydrolase, partial [Clostridia bacterium]|nr:alpha/beta hydrolase [Clostridia bacterium]